MSKSAAPEPLCDDRLDVIGNAPWWLISAGVHVALLLMATLVFVEKHLTIDDATIIVSVNPTRPPVIDGPFEPYDPGDKPKGLIDDPEEETPSDPDQVPIFFPDAEIGDHVETKNDGPDEDAAKGLSWKDLSHIEGGVAGGRIGQGEGPAGWTSSMGVGPGGGSGGFFGGNRGGDRNLTIRKNGGDIGTMASSEGALAWLARHQGPDGSWKAAGFTDQCHGTKCDGAGGADYDTGVTGLALLAYLGAGYTHLSSEGQTADLRTPGKMIRYKDVVKKAIRWLISMQDADGCASPKFSKMMYNQAIVALALAEAYGMTESQILKEPAQRAIDWLTEAKNPYGAWRYTARCGENDSSVTGWCVMALKSAKAANLRVSEVALHEANDWIKSVTETNYGRVGYIDKEGAGQQIVVDGKNNHYQNHEALGAVGMMTRIFVDTDRSDPVLDMTATCLVSDLPVWDKTKHTTDYYYWYYGTLALFQYDGPDSGGTGKYWKPWNEAIRKVLPKNQHTGADGCAAGSWDADDRWGYEGGRVYAVAINALTMEVYLRYPNAFGVANKNKKRE